MSSLQAKVTFSLNDRILRNYYSITCFDNIILRRPPDFVVQIGLCLERSDQAGLDVSSAARSVDDRATLYFWQIEGP